MVDDKDEPAGEGLPDGWLKEYRPRKNQHGSRMKGDMFYIDPVNGYEFRSLKDVYRYLQSGDVSRCVKLSNKRKIEDLHSARDPSHHTARTSDKSEASEIWSMQSGPNEHTPGGAESVTCKGVKNVEQRTKERKRKAKSFKQVATPLRSSPRLAALKMNQEANNACSDGRTSTETDTTNQLQPNQVKNPRRKANSSVLSERNDGTLTSSEKTEDNDYLVPNQIQTSVPCSSADVGCQNALAGVPVMAQVEPGGTTAGMPGSALSSLFQHVWSDPCLQFAFRTLIGDIPVLNNSLATANYFIPQQNMNKGATPNCFSSVYGGPRNHTQVDHVSLSLPRPSDNLYGSSWFPPQ